MIGVTLSERSANSDAIAWFGIVWSMVTAAGFGVRLQEVGEDVVGNSVACFDALVGIEAPMDTEIDSALCIFQFCLCEIMERSHNFRPGLSVGAGDGNSGSRP